MKNIFLFLCTFLFSFTLYAQESNHLKFKGIPIDGKLDDFVEKVKLKGFSKESDIENGALMKGVFANLDCELVILSTPKSHIVYKVAIFAPKRSSWISIKNSYTNFKSQYTKKYGKSSNEMEFFIKPYYDGDGFELQAIEHKKAYYISIWELQQGYIAVEIIKSCQVCFSYEDKINIGISNKEKEEIVQSDI